MTTRQANTFIKAAHAIGKMTDEQLRIKVAELAGWRLHLWKGQPSMADDPTERQWMLSGRLVRESQLPAYESDLNAMHEVEITLDHEQSLRYAALLHYGDGHEHAWDQRDAYEIATATARQRAEAFVKVAKLAES